TRAPVCAACQAAAEPAGPPPAIAKSYRKVIAALRDPPTSGIRSCVRSGSAIRRPLAPEHSGERQFEEDLAGGLRRTGARLDGERQSTGRAEVVEHCCGRGVHDL